jgi:hypothetical protein
MTATIAPMSSLLIFQWGSKDDCNTAHVEGEDVFPIPGTKRTHYLEENVAAFHIKLTAEDKQQLEAVFAADQVTSCTVITFQCCFTSGCVCAT